MAQYIDKAAIIAEIERRKSQFISQAESFREIGRKEQENYFAALASNMNSLSCFINTLEVIEVGFDLGDPNGDKSSEYIVDTKNLETKEVNLEKENNKELEDEILALNKRYPEVSFAKLSRIAVRVAKWQKEQDKKLLNIKGV